MDLSILLSANGFFLLIVLILLLSVSRRNGHSEQIESEVKKDIQKIKKQINGDE